MALKDYSVRQTTTDQVRAAAEAEFVQWEQRAEKYDVGPAYRGTVEIISVGDKPVFWRMRVSDRSNLIAQFIVDDGTGRGPRLMQAGDANRALIILTDSLTTRQYQNLRNMKDERPYVPQRARHCTRCGTALSAPFNNQCLDGHTTEWPKLAYVAVS
jgi:hypothetical protein